MVPYQQEFSSTILFPPPRLTPNKNQTDKPSTVLPTQLYTSIYFIYSITPHMTYINLLFPTPIMTHVQTPTHYHYKWSESIFILFWQSLHIHYFHHQRTHRSLSKWLESTVSSFLIGTLFFSLMSRKNRNYSYLIHNFTNTPIIAKPRLLHHLLNDANINTTETRLLN